MSFNLAPLRRQILDFAIKSPRISQALNLFGRAVNALSYAKVPLYCSPLYSRKISIDNIRAELHFNADIRSTLQVYPARHKLFLIK